MASQLDDNSVIVPQRRHEPDAGSPEPESELIAASGPWRVLARVLDVNSRASRQPAWRPLALWSSLPPRSRQIAIFAAGAVVLFLIGIWLGRITGNKPGHVPDWAGLPRATVTGVPLPGAPRFEGSSGAAPARAGASTTSGAGSLTSSMNLSFGDAPRDDREPSAAALTPSKIAPQTRPETPPGAAGSIESPSGIRTDDGSGHSAASSPQAGANTGARLPGPAARQRMARRDNDRRSPEDHDPDHTGGSRHRHGPLKPKIIGVQVPTDRDRP